MPKKIIAVKVYERFVSDDAWVAVLYADNTTSHKVVRKALLGRAMDWLMREFNLAFDYGCTTGWNRCGVHLTLVPCPE